jgi:hypothetical protein
MGTKNWSVFVITESVHRVRVQFELILHWFRQKLFRQSLTLTWSKDADVSAKMSKWHSV